MFARPWSVRALVLLVTVLFAACSSAPIQDRTAGPAPSAVSSDPLPPPASVSASPTGPASASPSGGGPSRTPPTRVGNRPGTVIITAHSRFGPMLYDASGQAIYLFAAERS